MCRAVCTSHRVRVLRGPNGLDESLGLLPLVMSTVRSAAPDDGAGGAPTSE